MSNYGRIGQELATKGPTGGAHFRNGIVKEHDVPRGRLRVTFVDRDNLASWWLPVAFRRTQDDQHFDIPDLGEQVVCLMDPNDEDGVVIGAIYSTADPTPGGVTADVNYRRYKDGTVVVYDRAAHVLDATFPDGAELKYDANASELFIKTPGTLVANVDGSVTVNSPEVTIESPNVKIGQSGGELPVMLNTIIAKYNGHAHPDPQGGNTGPPSILFSTADATANVVES